MNTMCSPQNGTLYRNIPPATSMFWWSGGRLAAAGGWIGGGGGGAGGVIHNSAFCGEYGVISVTVGGGRRRRDGLSVCSWCASGSKLPRIFFFNPHGDWRGWRWPMAIIQRDLAVVQAEAVQGPDRRRNRHRRNRANSGGTGGSVGGGRTARRVAGGWRRKQRRYFCGVW